MASKETKVELIEFLNPKETGKLAKICLKQAEYERISA